MYYKGHFQFQLFPIAIFQALPWQLLQENNFKIYLLHCSWQENETCMCYWSAERNHWWEFSSWAAKPRMGKIRFSSPLHVVLWDSLRIVFQSHLVLCVSMRLIVRNNYIFCFLHYFSNFFLKFWDFIIVINSIFLANSKNSLKSWMRSKSPEM